MPARVEMARPSNCGTISTRSHRNIGRDAAPVKAHGATAHQAPGYESMAKGQMKSNKEARKPKAAAPAKPIQAKPTTK
jgi:hypothetical protein